MERSWKAWNEFIVQVLIRLTTRVHLLGRVSVWGRELGENPGGKKSQFQRNKERGSDEAAAFFSRGCMSGRDGDYMDGSTDKRLNR